MRRTRQSTKTACVLNVHLSQIVTCMTAPTAPMRQKDHYAKLTWQDKEKHCGNIVSDAQFISAPKRPMHQVVRCTKSNVAPSSQVLGQLVCRMDPLAESTKAQNWLMCQVYLWIETGIPVIPLVLPLMISND